MLKISTLSPRLKSPLSGLVCGAANGFFGAGGGVLLVPLLTRWMRLDTRHAFATSLAVMLPLSALSLAVTLLRGAFDWRAAWPYLVGGVVGGGAAAMWFKRVPAIWLHRIFGGLLIVGGLKMLFAGNIHIGGNSTTGAWQIVLAITVGSITGFISGCGVGGGTLLLLYLTGVQGVAPYIAGGVNLAYFLCCCPVALIGHVRQKLVDWSIVWRCLLLGVPTALLCAWAAAVVDTQLLRQLFGGGIILVGVREMFTNPL